MLGIWEYFWNVLDWTGVPDTKNILNLQAQVSGIENITGTVLNTHTNTGLMTPTTLKIGNI